MEKFDINNLQPSDFEFTQTDAKLSDKKLETKPVGYFRDAFNRFCKNKGSVVAAFIIMLLFLFAIFVPMFSSYDITFVDGKYAFSLPKISFMEGTGVWDGTSVKTLSQADYDYYLACGVESGRPVITQLKKTEQLADGNMSYTCRIDSYNKTAYFWKTLTQAQYEAVLAYQEETGIQMLYPLPEMSKMYYTGSKPQNRTDTNPNYWFETTNKGLAVYQKDENGEILTDENGMPLFKNIYEKASKPTTDPTSIYYYNGTRLAGDEGYWKYYSTSKSSQTGEVSYTIRTNYHNLFVYENGKEPCFLFGTNSTGNDILVSLAQGARLSFLLAICVSAINLVIGALYGAIEGYYGGTVDLVLERVSDILSGVPFIVVATLFQLHLAAKVGVVPSLLFAFVLTGWIGTASNVRMQFYRFKSQEYVLAARTLGAKDGRLIWRHIFPNSLGTIVTRSVLVIPSVIFSESMLSYLGIVNLETGGMTSVGVMLSKGEKYLSTYPHCIVFPAVFLSLLMISFNLFGNGLRDAFNPSLRGSEG